ncbi:hypothetical protein FC789_15580 [Clostridium botulinum]|nr:hypothetical protein [Clostridium botulinum]
MRKCQQVFMKVQCFKKEFPFLKEVDSLALVNKSCTIENINKIRIDYSITSDDHGIKDRDEKYYLDRFMKDFYESYGVRRNG